MFEVSSDVVKTFGPLKWPAKANYTQHKVHGGKYIPEYIGVDADTISFDMYLSSFLGVRPQDELHKLRLLLAGHKICQMVLGTQPFGTWVVQSVNADVQYITGQGDMLQIKVAVTILQSTEPAE